MKYSVFFVVFLLFQLQDLCGQSLSAPRISCVIKTQTGKDSIRWLMPACPTANMKLYGREIALGGSFALLNSGLAAVGYYLNPNAISGVGWEYYAEYTCAGSSSPTSAVVNNLPLTPPIIENVTVEQGRTVVNWVASSSPQVNSYNLLVERSGADVYVPLTTLLQGTSYTDNFSTPTSRAERVTVTAEDACQNESLRAGYHKTVFMTHKIIPCERAIKLNWTLYEGWQGIAQQRVMVKVNSGIFAAVKTLTGAETDYTYLANSGDKVCLYIESKSAANAQLTSKSNEICVDAVVNNEVDSLVAMLVTNDHALKVLRLDAFVDTNSTIQTLDVERAGKSGTFSSVLQLKKPFTTNFLQIKIPAEYNTTACYRLKSTDACGVQKTSELTCPPILKEVKSEDMFHRMTYQNPLVNKNVTPYNFELERLKNISFVSLIGSKPYVAKPDTLKNKPDLTQVTDSLICYHLLFRANIKMPDGLLYPTYIQSNELCIKSNSFVYLPNAFTPGGLNPTFGPVIAFPGSVKNYLMNIYNRSGQLIFTSTSPSYHWDGSALPATDYIYELSLDLPGGGTFQQKGLVHLVR